MAISIKDFWRLLVESRLYGAAECEKLQGRFAQLKGEGDSAACAQWLVDQRALTRYQAKVLLGGHAGPFIYGSYQLRDRLKSGRLGGCFRAVHVPTRHKVLLWFLSGPILQDANTYYAAVRQLSDAIEIVHPCLSRTYQVVDLGAYKFVVLEDLTGASADEALAARGPLPAADGCRVMRQIALAVAALHAGNVTHGDIRPQNVWIDSKGHARLLQIPLSREPHLPPGSPLDLTLPTERSALLADYTAPELGLSNHVPDALTDIYAIGCTLYQLVAGRPPFSGGDLATKLKRHATEPIASAGVSPELFKVVSYAMAKDRKLRFQLAAQLADALAHFVDPQQRNLVPERIATDVAFQAWLATQPSTPAVPIPAPHARADIRPTDAADANSPAGHTTSATASAPVRSTVVADAPIVQPAALPEFTSASDSGVLHNSVGIPLVTTAAQATSATALIRQRRRRARNNALFGLALLASAGVGVGIGYVVYQRGRSAEVAGQEGPVSNGAGAHGSNAAKADDRDVAPENGSSAEGAAETIVPDDGKTLWASPTAGEPISWAYLPVRAEILLAVRPTALLRHAEGEKLMAALGPNGASARAAVEEAIGMPLAEVEQLLVAGTSLDGIWTATYVVRPATTISRQSLEAKWQAFEPRSQGSEKYSVSAGRTYSAPAAEEGKLFVVSAVEHMPELLTVGSNASPLIREMVKLLQTSDREQSCHVLFTKKALLADAETRLAAGGLGRLHDALAWWLGDDVQAAGISLHLAESCYLEARLVGRAQSTTASELTAAMKERMKRLAPDIEEFLSRIDLHPHGRRVLIGLASMSRFVQQQLRIESENEQVVINCYLPAMAAHNLILAAELAIVQPVADTAPPLPKVTSTGADQPSSVAEKLKRSISFLQSGDTLEKALQTVSAEIGVPIEILGTDLAPEGITRNNRFDVNAKDQAASEVIRAILLAANRDGKLVYVIRPKQPGGEDMIFITTRVAAGRRGDKLPPEFAAPAGIKSAKTQAGPKKK